MTQQAQVHYHIIYYGVQQHHLEQILVNLNQSFIYKNIKKHNKIMKKNFFYLYNR